MLNKTSLLVLNWRQKSKTKAPLSTRMALFYGVCGMYSTIFVGAQYGVDLYARVIVIYTCSDFGQGFCKECFRNKC